MSKRHFHLLQQSRALRANFAQSMVFLRRFAGAPRRIGSVTPSSPYLTRAMLDKVDWAKTRSVAELGAGTGVFTRAIVRRMSPGTKLLVFEVDPELQRMIADEHLDISLYGDARELPKIVRGHGLDGLDCVISSLPFTVLPSEVTQDILDAVCEVLKPEGRFVAYQYSKIMKGSFEKRFERMRTSFVLRNIPPAFVYDCTGPQREDSESEGRR
ncbi:MAG: methyltransferase type 11 [Fretibacterium sp.]|nr:methyltransferase type 11 [Fretibacterium sp.]